MSITIYSLDTYLPLTEVETIHEAEDLVSHGDNLFYYPSEAGPCPNYIESLNTGYGVR